MKLDKVIGTTCDGCSGGLGHGYIFSISFLLVVKHGWAEAKRFDKEDTVYM